MSPKSKDSRLRLGEPLSMEFAAFRAALGLGASEIGIVRDAVRSFIKSRTDRDDELKARYEEELGRLAAAKIQPLRLVAKDEN